MSAHVLNPDDWIDTYGDLLLNYSLQRVPERDVARDLVQDAFVSALKSQERYRGEVSEKNWLFLILRSRIMDYYKKKKEVLASEFGNDDEEENSDSFFDKKGAWIRDMRPQAWSTDDAVREKEFMKTLQGCLGKLKVKQRDVFAMKYIEGLETDAVCKELEVSSSNYWVLIHRAKLSLRNCLEHTWLT